MNGSLNETSWQIQVEIQIQMKIHDLRSHNFDICLQRFMIQKEKKEIWRNTEGGKCKRKTVEHFLFG